MRTGHVVRILSVLMAVTAGAAAAPKTGLYESPEAGSDFLIGHWSESFVGGGEGQIGNTIHGASWDGAQLTDQWEIAGPAIDAAPVLIFDDVDPVTGDGIRIYFTTYSGGVVTLGDSGPWWNTGDSPAYTEYLADVEAYSHTTTKVYDNFQEAGFSSSVYLRAVFQDFPEYEIWFLEAVAIPHGVGQPLPVGYPSFIGASAGAWGEVQNIRMEIIPEPASVGLLLAGAACLAARRRRDRR